MGLWFVQEESISDVDDGIRCREGWLSHDCCSSQRVRIFYLTKLFGGFAEMTQMMRFVRDGGLEKAMRRERNFNDGSVRGVSENRGEICARKKKSLRRATFNRDGDSKMNLGTLAEALS